MNHVTRFIGLALASACALFSLPAFAQELTEITMDAPHLAHALDRLSNTQRVLYIAAHPDDENTRFLAYLANGRHIQARYLSMTRGGGGQNLIGSEQDALLDVLRTQELLSARRLDGATQRFTRVRDFGYSKSAEETLSIWGHDAALSDVVYAIRSFRPDVIVTRFDEQPPNHGHHTASAILAREAFTAAADPQRFPEQLTAAAGLSPWQAKRLLHNWPFWKETAPPKEAISIDVGGYDPRLGLSFGELAARSRTQHKSQGFGATPERGVLLEHFLPIAGERASKDILDAVPASWAERFGQPGAAVDKALEQARHFLHRDHPEAASTPLAAAYAALAALPQNDPRVQTARKQTAELALFASGVFMRATSQASACVSGGKLPVKIELLVRRPSALKLARVLFPDGQTQNVPEPLRVHNKYELSATVTCPGDAQPTAPYWLREPHGPGLYVHEQAELDQPAGKPPLILLADFELAGQALRLNVPLLFSITDRVQGERERPVLVVPPMTVTPAREAIMFPNGAAAKVSLRVRAGADAQRGRVFLELPAGYQASPTEIALDLAKAGDERVVEFSVTPPPGASASQRATPVIEVNGRRSSLREDIIDYPHVPTQIVLQPASLKLSPLTLTKPHGLIGYVEGSGDSIPADLAHIGATVERLSDSDLMQGKLSRYSSIILGVRAYNTRDVLRAANPRLMQYVADGGILLVQYVTRSGISPLDVPVGPYALEIGRGRVTDENASVSELIKDHPLLRTPHKIGPKDYEGWLQERGLYFGQTWDPKYQALLSMADKDEPAERGALLVAKHGKGRYVYTGLSFFRELPAGVPGAYRLFLNLIAADGGSGAKAP